MRIQPHLRMARPTLTYMPALLWFRRDLRLHDNPALLEAATAGSGEVCGLFVLDPKVWDSAAGVRQAYLLDSLAELNASMNGKLLIRAGRPEVVVPQVAAQIRATSVHLAADFGPYGVTRDGRVAAALATAGITWAPIGSPYAVAPGRVTKKDGTAYRVYTPFYRAWLAHGWRPPANAPTSTPNWILLDSDDALPQRPDLGAITLPAAGEKAALERWESFQRNGLSEYDELRNRPDLAGTSTLGHHLKWGEIHPRTILADLDDSPGADTFRKEIAWREFYADVMTQQPTSSRISLDRRFDEVMDWASGPAADEAFTRWAHGNTGFPFVDAGMRQLRAEGWMHNRVRMVVASFLVKDLHLPWQRGAHEFMRWLRDGDIASNSHGWQWAAGCGTDASPYHRIFNPVGQGERFDPNGDYVRRYIPQLRHLTGPSSHTPWLVPDGYDHGYPERMVDHSAERLDALARFAEAKAVSTRD